MDAHRREFIRFAGLGAAGIGFSAAQSEAQARRMSGTSFGGHIWFPVRAYGAAGDGVTIDSTAINRAIEAVAAAGGGTVYFGPGTYASYSIRLKDNVTLYLDHGATILAAKTTAPGNVEGSYDAAEPNPNMAWDRYEDFGHNHWHNSLIWGEGLKNVSILGPGLIWGKGLSRGGKHDVPRAEDPGIGNKSIALKNCRNVLLRDFSILEGGHFAILATGVDNLTIDHLTIDTNRDGMDIDCCWNVRISNCSVNSPTDDAICPKSSYALGYARPTKNLTISDCYVTGTYEVGTLLDGSFRKFSAADKVLRQGGIKCGTESNGGFENIAISNCVLEGCRGIQIESVDGALAEDICISNVTMRDIQTAPLFMRLGSRMRGPTGVPVGKLRRILVNNIVCSNSASRVASIISGIPGHWIEDIRISNVFVQHQGGAPAAQAALQPPERETRRPDSGMFGPMPAQGFFLRHVRNLSMSHIEVAALAQDARPSFVLDDVADADFLGIRCPCTPGVPMFAMQDVEQFSLRFSRGLADIAISEAVKQDLYASS